MRGSVGGPRGLGELQGRVRGCTPGVTCPRAVLGTAAASSALGRGADIQGPRVSSGPAWAVSRKAVES